MKKSLQEQQMRILEIMSKMDSNLLLTELNEKYLDKILDKINQYGVDSLTRLEKEALDKMSKGVHVDEPEVFSQDDHIDEPQIYSQGDGPEVYSLGINKDTLLFTSFNYMSEDSPEKLSLKNKKLTITGRPRYDHYFIHGNAKDITGDDRPLFLAGDLSQLDKEIKDQDIRLITPKGEYECIALVTAGAYYLVLKPEWESLN